MWKNPPWACGEEKIEAECRISIERDRKKNAESSALIAARHEALLAAKQSAKRKADEWGQLFLFRFLWN